MNSWALIFGSEFALILVLLRFFTFADAADALDNGDAFLAAALALPVFSL